MSDGDDQPALGVRISRRLIDKLAGRPVVREEGPGSSAPSIRKEPVERVIPRSGAGGEDGGDVITALQKSRRVGVMLLKNEAEEMGKVRGMIEALHSREYRPPSNDPPCGGEKDACLSCYTSNADDPLKCAAQVAAFTSCTRQAQAAYMSART